MRALLLEKYGGPDSVMLGEAPRPEPGKQEALVRVHAAGLNPVDYKFRQGLLRVIHRPPLPVIMGNDLAGTVEAIGGGATRFAPGDRVFCRCETTKMGALAEFCVIAEEFMAAMPRSIGFESAAATPLAGITALQCLRNELRVQRGERIFISGGAGGVGVFAIQIAKILGAEVTTTASPRGETLAKSLGADRVIDYTRQDFVAALRELSGTFDGALDLVGGATLKQMFRIVKAGRQVVSIAGIPEPTTAERDLAGGTLLKMLFWIASLGLRLRARRRGVRYRYYLMHSSGADLEQLAAWIDADRLRVVVDRVFPFSQVKEAFGYLEQGHAKGKVVVRIAE